MRYNIRKANNRFCLLLLATLLLPDYSFAQDGNLAFQLSSRLESGDIDGAKKLLARGLQNNYFFLVACPHPSGDNVKIQVSYPTGPPRIFQKALPYLHVGDRANETGIRFAFVHIKGGVETPMTGTYKPSDYANNHLAYLILSHPGILSVKYILELPAPPDTVCFKMPSRRFLNYRVISSGTVAGISSAWFLLQRAEAQTKLDAYYRAVETAEVINLRAEVEKFRARRNIAGALSAVSGAAFAYFLAKDIFYPERKKQINCKDRDTTWDSDKKLHFGFEPNLNTNGIQITMNLNF